MRQMAGSGSGPSDCKGCGEQYEVTEERIIKAVAVIASRTELCVPDEVYEARLTACRSCEQLLGGHTCSACGCFVRVAAKLKARSCPSVTNRRWDHYVEMQA